MASDTSSQQTGRELLRSRRRGLYRGILPSWFFSVWFHVGVLFVAALGLRSCTGQGEGGEADTQWQTVGLVMRMEAAKAREPSESSAAKTKQPHTPNEENLSQSETPTVSSDAVEMPQSTAPNSSAGELAPVIGPGSAVPKFSPASQSAGEPGRAATGAIAPSALSAGQTEFFDIRSSADRIVYVIDISGSMANPPSAIRSAKRELLSSLSTLSNKQQFQVIFYNNRPKMMRIPGQPPGELIPASDINRTLASQAIAAVRPNRGTNPMPALRMALGLEPDVVYFLTDAQKGSLSRGELEQITLANGGEARIHAIEFGKGDRLAESSVMERLARQNSGVFEYHDVTAGAR